MTTTRAEFEAWLGSEWRAMRGYCTMCESDCTCGRNCDIQVNYKFGSEWTRLCDCEDCNCNAEFVSLQREQEERVRRLAMAA